MRKIFRFLSLFISISLLTLSFSCITATATEQKSVNEKNSEAIEAINTINDLTRISMEKEILENQNASMRSISEYDKQIDELKQKIEELGVKKLTKEDLLPFLAADISPLASHYPLPDDTEAVDFYQVFYEISSGEMACCLIAGTNVNVECGANQMAVYNGSNGNNMANLLSNGASTLIDIYASKLIDGIISQFTVFDWFPYELFTDLFDGTPSTGTIEEYEFTLLTRTVTMFVYLYNSYDEPVYYGSSNCVHVNTEQIARNFKGSRLVTDVQNTYELVTADHYLTFPDYCIPENHTGFGVTPIHSFINNITIRVGGIGQNSLSINVPTYRTLIAAVTDAR